MRVCSSTFFIRAEVSARRAATAHVLRVSSERAHVPVSRTASRVMHAPIPAVPICFTAAGHAKATEIITFATGAHTIATLASIEVDAAARVLDHV